MRPRDDTDYFAIIENHASRHLVVSFEELAGPKPPLLAVRPLDNGRLQLAVTPAAVKDVMAGYNIGKTEAVGMLSRRPVDALRVLDHRHSGKKLGFEPKELAQRLKALDAARRSRNLTA